jgi:Z1 domain-containing protein
MTWSALHKASEEFAKAAHQSVRLGHWARAKQLFALAAAQERRALEALEQDKTRTFGVTAVSATALNYKAELLGPAEIILKQALQDSRLPQFAREQLESLLQGIAEARLKRNAEEDVDMEAGLYERLAAQRGDSADLISCVYQVVEKLKTVSTDGGRPGMLLGKIQSGKTRGFIGTIAAAFDDGFDIAIVLTKGTKALSQQTVKRLRDDLKAFRDEDVLDVHDIMAMPELNQWEIERKLIIVAKKQKQNLVRLLKLFQEDRPELAGKRVLIVDDEADLASVRFRAVRESDDPEQGIVADQIDKLRRTIHTCAYLQVTATPYSLYLQPKDYEATEHSDFVFEPKRPAFTELLPIHRAYVGGDQYFGDHDPGELEYYLWHEVSREELDALRKADRRVVKSDLYLTGAKIEALRHAVIAFVVGVVVRNEQLRASGKPSKKFSLIVHIETKRSAQTWQKEVFDGIIDALHDAIEKQEPVADRLMREVYDDLSRSVSAAGLAMPLYDFVAKAAKEAIGKKYLTVEKVNSDNDVAKLLDENAELKLRTPYNVFIGGQILDRGITVPNLISFYYGRSPKRMQQDTVLQHSRMYGARPREDLAVTRFYTSIHNYECLRKIHEFDSALRNAFESGAHDRGVAFIQTDAQRRIAPCTPSKILMTQQVAIRPGRGLVPIGFQSRAKTHIAGAISEIERAIPAHALGTGKPQKIDLVLALKIVDLVEPTLEFDKEDGYAFDWNGLRAALEYFATIAAPKSERDKVWILAETDRELSRKRSGGRVSNAPDTKQQARAIAAVAGSLPALLLIGQKGRKEDGWGGYPFWWPVFFAPANAVPVVFASETQDMEEPDEDEE